MLNYPEIDPIIFSIGPLAVRWYGLMYVIGFVAAWLLASKRAKEELMHLGIIQQDEMAGVRQTLDAAAWTYVAAFVTSLGTLLYYLLMFMGRRD